MGEVCTAEGDCQRSCSNGTRASNLREMSREQIFVHGKSISCGTVCQDVQIACSITHEHSFLHE